MSVFTDKLAALQSNEPQAPAAMAPGVNAPPPADPPQMPEKITQDQPAAPWANPDCPACTGSGFNTNDNPCRICDGKPPYARDYVWEESSDGTRFYSPKDEAAPAAPPPATSIATPPVAASPPPVITVTEPVAPLSASAPKASAAAKPIGRGRPRSGFTMLINVAVSKKPNGTKMVYAADLLEKYGQLLAEEQGKESYYDLNAFDRRDSMAQAVPLMLEDIGSALLVADGESPDLRSLVDHLKPHAYYVYGG